MEKNERAIDISHCRDLRERLDKCISSFPVSYFKLLKMGTYVNAMKIF